MKTRKKISRWVKSFSLLIVFAITFTACGDYGSKAVDIETELNLVELAQENENFSTLVQALIDADLVTALEGDGPFTVFAPTNDAFAALPQGTLESLTIEQLTEILQFHVVSGNIASTDLLATQDVPTLLGQDLLVESEGGVTINGNIAVVDADNFASNGVIHAINQVLLPEGFRPANIIDQAKELEIFSTLVGAVDQVGLTTTLQYKGNFTVFAPTDDAFAALPSGLLGSLTNAQLTEILTYHVLNGEVFAADLAAEQAAPSLQGDDLFITANAGEVAVNGSSNVVTADVDVSNGVIHAVNRVLLPDAYGTVVDAASKRYNFQTLVSAVVDAGLADALSNADGTFTVFAPTDEAFAALPAGLLESLTPEQLAEILQYHVLDAQLASGDLEASQAPATLIDESVYVTVEGGTVTVNGSATVIEADITTSNGVIHAIDQVLIPNSLQDVVEIAQKNYALSSLVNLVADANLVTTLQGVGPFTVFAPTNAAFDAASDLVATLSPEQVTAVLTYHVAAAQALAGDLTDGQVIETVQGENITVSIDGETVTLNGNVNVVTANQVGTNGVVHIIDGVLVPPSFLETAATEITINNVGASAWIVTSINGNNASATLNENNTNINLATGARYTFINLGSGPHPLDFRNSQNTVLLSEGSSTGTFESDTDVNFVVEGNRVSFTLTAGLAAEIAKYFCTFHGSMNGTITVN